jgi:1,4-dihydroxy-2-naphthoate octaprenyltransferase
MKRETLRAWYQASRPPFFVATFIPLALGGGFAAQRGSWDAGLFLLVAFGCFLVHLATNLSNDYYDHLAGADSGASIGGSRVIQQGKIGSRAIGRALLLLYGGTFLMASAFIVARQLWGLIPLVLFALASSYCYVAPPVRYGYHGLGELFVGINMGPVMLLTAEWALAGSPSREAFLVSLPVGVMVASILYYQSLPDRETDAAIGKRTLAVRLGRSGAIAGLVGFFTLILGGIAALVAAGIVSPWGLTAFSTLVPMTILLGIVVKTQDWVELDHHGGYVRMIYFGCGLALILGVALR